MCGQAGLHLSHNKGELVDFDMVGKKYIVHLDTLIVIRYTIMVGYEDSCARVAAADPSNIPALGNL